MAGQHHVVIVVFDGVQSLDVTGPLEVLAGANLAGGQYDISILSVDGQPVRTSSGLRLLPDGALAGPPDLLIVPGGAGTKRGDPRLVAWLREHGPRAARLTSVCTGAFLLAEAGLLDGRRATTHWDHCAALARRYPAVTVDPEPIYVRDGAVATSAGVTAGIDLALALVEDDHGRDTALAIARHLVMFLRRPGGQRQFSAQLAAQVAARDPLRDIQRYAAEHPAADLSVPALARRANLSPRQFSRAFAAEVGTPPGRYVDQVRLESARRLLEERHGGVEEVARACGYGTPEAMRRAFVRELGISPADYRERC
ncbi:GlxA family transcriptional regulator [Dactylosporangium matsuzakiense]|uniref:Transcriptional regulator n=1 Tax=Dactylosporangium matsuzakiense TaxID=53360 RepID=A0A9W6NPV2_9ACTN|nr:GlxA family transcriptional regulator [Dactylosporangium matsuzakiense]UWZ42025.1 GlxA family transcriptional regulator [Dactylosporangium matsuzakiense]GLL04889.1 transcriptional regulator [Dactylosporangium matsuzakiense]